MLFCSKIINQILTIFCNNFIKFTFNFSEVYEYFEHRFSVTKLILFYNENQLSKVFIFGSPSYGREIRKSTNLIRRHKASLVQQTWVKCVIFENAKYLNFRTISITLCFKYLDIKRKNPTHKPCTFSNWALIYIPKWALNSYL